MNFSLNRLFVLTMMPSPRIHALVLAAAGLSFVSPAIAAEANKGAPQLLVRVASAGANAGRVDIVKVIESADLKLAAKRINVWGVSFDPKLSNRFMATVGAGGQVFLAEGDVQAKTLTLLRAEMECPSFSPDGTRVAFKRRNPAGGWLPAVYELGSGREWVMKEAHSIDDQI